MGRTKALRRLAWGCVLLAAGVVLAGEVSTEPRVEEAAGDPAAGETPQQPAAAAEPRRKVPDLGLPLVEDPKALIRLDMNRPLWFDRAKKRVVMIGQVCQRNAPLEMFACLAGTKEHEAVLSVDVPAHAVHAALMVAGAEPGHPVKWDPEYVPATGTQIEVTVIWKDKEGKQQTARAQDWVQDVRSKKAMDHPWVFAGSGTWKNEETGEEYYLAEGGDFICVSNFPSAMLDLPVKSSEANEALLFRAFTERIPPLGTPVTMVLTPKLEEEKAEAEKGKPEGETGKPEGGEGKPEGGAAL